MWPTPHQSLYWNVTCVTIWRRGAVESVWLLSWYSRHPGCQDWKAGLLDRSGWMVVWCSYVLAAEQTGASIAWHWHNLWCLPPRISFGHGFGHRFWKPQAWFSRHLAIPWEMQYFFNELFLGLVFWIRISSIFWNEEPWLIRCSSRRMFFLYIRLLPGTFASSSGIITEAYHLPLEWLRKIMTWTCYVESRKVEFIQLLGTEEMWPKGHKVSVMQDGYR